MFFQERGVGLVVVFTAFLCQKSLLLVVISAHTSMCDLYRETQVPGPEGGVKKPKNNRKNQKKTKKTKCTPKKVGLEMAWQKNMCPKYHK